MNKQEKERYTKVYEQMHLLNIQEVTTERQRKNGTRTFKLPIKNYWPGNTNPTYIEVASFKTGYVRNNNSASSNYQLNKCGRDVRYYKLSSGDYRKYVGKTRIKIPIEIDRLEYLIGYCLKNYYIKNANRIAYGDYIPKWKLENSYSNGFNDGKEEPEVQVIVNGQRYKVI